MIAPDFAEQRYLPIADYAIIGNTRTAALIASNGSLDWYCPPRFDSPALFCRLLDAKKGGRFRVGPGQGYACSRAYVDATNVLTMTYEGDAGCFRLTDFMPMPPPTALDGDREAGAQIVRRVEGLKGECEVEIDFLPTFDFGRVPAQLEVSTAGLLACGGEATVVLQCPVPLQLDGGGGAKGKFSIKAGECVDMCLEYQPAARTSGGKTLNAAILLSETIHHWHQWSSQLNYQGRYRQLVLRSALTLSLLTYTPTGAIVAAPTTSLPEEIGGSRNWDYRYTWVRDSALILQAMMSIGFHKEAHAFFDWLEGLCIKCDGDLQIMYSIDGSTELPEETLDHLEGYRESYPVRIGNAASGQKQLDIYGEMLDAVAFCYESMRMQPPRPEVWKIYRGLADQAASRWREPDEGIWELRGERRHHLYSKLQCWVALDRALRLAEQGSLPADLFTWRSTREEIRRAIVIEGYNAEMGAFVQAFGVKALDATALMIPLVGFLPATDARVRSTLTVIQEQLGSRGGLVFRYNNKDGLPGGEAAFVLCSFWLVDNLVLAGQISEARELFERVAGYGNDVGLFAEEINPSDGALLGNYPQGFTHLALIRSAVLLAAAEAGGEDTGQGSLDS